MPESSKPPAPRDPFDPDATDEYEPLAVPVVVAGPAADGPVPADPHASQYAKPPRDPSAPKR